MYSITTIKNRFFLPIFIHCVFKIRVALYFNFKKIDNSVEALKK